MTERHQVELFLLLMRTTAADRFLLRDRQKNRDAFALLGITSREAQAHVVALTVGDYVSGPSANLDRPGEEVWVFGARVRGSEIYIKLAVITDPCACICISFHEAEQPMVYPFR
jgi:hypothetical protein